MRNASKNWIKYDEYLLTVDWHIHTNWTDGENTVFEYCERAVQEGIPLIAFIEHVRKKLNYDFRRFFYRLPIYASLTLDPPVALAKLK